jgi:putative NADH-flavin reductase
MQLTLFGATGRTGQHLLEQALSAGYEVKVLVRDPSKIKAQGARLEVLAGDVQNAAQVEQAVADAECVISVLGPTVNKPTYEISAGTENILAAMKKQGVRRLIVSAGAGVGDPEDAPALFDLFINFLLKLLSRHVYEDMLQTVAKIRASDLDWTIVRVPMLTDGPQTGKIQVGYVGKGMGSRISRADMAAFMLKQVNDNAYLHKAPAISN